MGPLLTHLWGIRCRAVLLLGGPGQAVGWWALGLNWTGLSRGSGWLWALWLLFLVLAVNWCARRTVPPCTIPWV